MLPGLTDSKYLTYAIIFTDYSKDYWLNQLSDIYSLDVVSLLSVNSTYDKILKKLKLKKIRKREKEKANQITSTLLVLLTYAEHTGPDSYGHKWYIMMFPTPF